MMLNDLIKLKKFTPEEKEYSLPMALRLLDLSKVVALYGVLGLLDATLSDSNALLRYGVRMVVDGNGSAYVESELVKKILALEYTDRKLLESIIIAQGLLTFCDMAFTPTKTVEAITTLMGDEYATALMSKIREDHNPDEELTEAEQAALLAD